MQINLLLKLFCWQLFVFRLLPLTFIGKLFCQRRINAKYFLVTLTVMPSQAYISPKLTNWYC
jgi:hypothetical protein